MTDRLHWRQLFSVPRPIQCRHWIDRSGHYAHDHDFYELVAISAGSGRHRSADGERAIGAGDLILLGPGVWHEYVGCAALSGFDCCFSKELLYREFAWITDDPVLGQLLLRSTGTSFHRRPVFARIERQALARITGLLGAISDPKVRSRDARGARLDRPPRDDGSSHLELFGTMLLVLGSFADAVRPSLGDRPAAIRPAFTALATRAQALLAEDLTREWSLGELAGALGTSPSFLSRACSMALKRSPMAFYMHSRMEHAARLLLRSRLAVSEIGARVGIFDANYFARRFRAEFGLAPSAYRARFVSEP